MFADNVIVPAVAMLAVSALSYYFMMQADRGVKYFVRKIPGIDILDEALQRSTEMGGSVNFSVGDVATLSGILVTMTIAGFEVLGHIARYCARMRTKLFVAVLGRSGSGGELIPIQAEIIRDAYAQEGHEEDFNPQIIQYLGGDSQAYETGFYDYFKKNNVTTNVFIGAWAGKGSGQPSFIAKSLGIVNITGTARMFAMPTLCYASDYFFIGEEIYAAGGYLAQDEGTLATIRLTDLVKYALLAILIVGSLAMWAGSDIVKTLLAY